MNKRILRSCSILAFGLTAIGTAAWADDDAPAIQGVWFTVVTPADCQNFRPIPTAASFRGLTMFGEGGSVTNEAAFLMAIPRRSSGLGAWQHTQGHMYTADFRFFRYNADGSLLAIRKVSLVSILVNGNQITTMDKFQDYDANNNPLPPNTQVPTSGCNIETGTRVQ